MTMALSLPLQRAVYTKLLSDLATTSALGGPKVFDGPPHASAGNTEPPYIVMGDEAVTAFDTADGSGASHILTLTIWSRTGGYAELKGIMAAVSDALDRADLPLDRGTLIDLRFQSATLAREGRGRLRRATCQFRAVVEDD